MKTEGLNYQSWDEHIKEGAIISLFENYNNQLRKSPNIDSQVAFTDIESGAYECKEMQGDWIKVRNFTSDNNEEGWVRWRKDDTLLLSLWYIL